MINRIQQIIQTKGLSSSQFADLIKVKRANVSHILTGRNKPSLDFITKILTSYPDINSDWLLFGKGIMEGDLELEFDTTSIVEEPISGNSPKMFSTKSKQVEYHKPKKTTTEEDSINKIKPEKTKSKNKLATKVIVLYSDNSFDEFKPSS